MKTIIFHSLQQNIDILRHFNIEFTLIKTSATGVVLCVICEYNALSVHSMRNEI